MLLRQQIRHLHMQPKLRLFDVAANLADETFNGFYFGKKHHPNDVDIVMKRANAVGVDKFLIASGYYDDCRHSHEICKAHPGCYGTIGIHPCRASEVLKGPKQYFEKMETLFAEFKDLTVAVGECGLDYDRLNYASVETQKLAFPIHFDWAEKYGLPMYLHSRNCKDDFLSIVRLHRHRFPGGIVHSYTGDEEELRAILDMGLYVGVNGCSLKTPENVDIVRKIPLDRIVLETDAPYCEIRATHEGAKYLKLPRPVCKAHEKYDPNFPVKGRNEPSRILEILDAVAHVKGVPHEVLATHAYENTCKALNIK